MSPPQQEIVKEIGLSGIFKILGIQFKGCDVELKKSLNNTFNVTPRPRQAFAMKGQGNPMLRETMGPTYGHVG